MTVWRYGGGECRVGFNGCVNEDKGADGAQYFTSVVVTFRRYVSEAAFYLLLRVCAMQDECTRAGIIGFIRHVGSVTGDDKCAGGYGLQEPFAVAIDLEVLPECVAGGGG